MVKNYIKDRFRKSTARFLSGLRLKLGMGMLLLPAGQVLAVAVDSVDFNSLPGAVHLDVYSTST